ARRAQLRPARPRFLPGPHLPAAAEGADRARLRLLPVRRGTMATAPTAPAAPHWYEDAVFYELPVKAFADGNHDGVGDFAGLTSKLDSLADLGVTCLWLLPFQPSPLRDDGYDVADYRGVHPRHGTVADFRAFVEAAHRGGLRVMAEMAV